MTAVLAKPGPYIPARRVRCPTCGAPSGRPCDSYPGAPLGAQHVHRTRVESFSLLESAQEEIAMWKASQAPRGPRGECPCLNHLAHPKTLYGTRAEAITWAGTSRRVRGLVMEPYPCPSGKGWHMRTARQRFAYGRR